MLEGGAVGEQRRRYTDEDLREILRLHAMWLLNQQGATRAILDGADLSGAGLSGAVLRAADLTGAKLTAADFTSADLSGIVLDGAYLNGAILCGAILRDAKLSGAVLCHANLSNADLRNAYLWNADLRGAILDGVLMDDTMLDGACFSPGFQTPAPPLSRNSAFPSLSGGRPYLDFQAAFPHRPKRDLSACLLPPSPSELPESAQIELIRILTGPKKYGDGRDSLRDLRLFVRVGSLRGASNGKSSTLRLRLNRLEERLGVALMIPPPPDKRGPDCKTIPTEAAQIIVAWLDMYANVLPDDSTSRDA